ncbi:MAG: sigma 54-interacting transcriptional regulator [Myxococcota bacterium]
MKRTDRLEERPAEAKGAIIWVHPAQGEPARRVVRRGEVLTVGSSDAADLFCNDRYVSSRHLQIEVVRAGLMLTDLDSSNGTFYLAGRIQRALVPHGSTIHLGQSTLRLLARDDEDPEGLSDKSRYGRLIGSSPAMRRLYRQLEQIESSDATVLVLGETGVGKELVASEIHAKSARRSSPYAVFDCGAVSPELIESELFGHSAGAFTGAHTERAGVFEAAHSGTVFLDEIGELPPTLQPKLLRVLESRTLKRLGSEYETAVDFRVIAATHRNLADMCEQGEFREDLYYRLNVVTLTVPPLRQRREDIPDLVASMALHVDPNLRLSPSTIELFTSSYDWPGNVRELRHAIMRVAALGEAPALEMTTNRGERAFAVDVRSPLPQEKKRILDAFEREYLEQQLEESGGNLSEAARRSGVDRSYFRRLLKRHQI